MIIAAAALNQTPLDWIGNFNRIESAVNQAKSKKANLILLPELSVSGYGCEDYFLMPWVLEKAREVLVQQVLPLSQNIFIAIGLPFSHKGISYNTLALCYNGQLKGLYAKQILPKSGVFYEPRWFEPWPANTTEIITVGNDECPIGDFTLEFNGLTLGFEICEDAWHPEKRPAVTGAARDADLILNASASNYARGKQAERHDLITSLKGKNDAYYLYTNLLGNESGRLIFDGEILFGSDGEIGFASKRFSMQETTLEIFEINFDKPAFKAIEPVNEDEFEDFTDAVSLALLDYLRKSKSKGFALSLSGGADSATCAIMVAEMLKRASKQLSKQAIEQKLGFELKGANIHDWVNQILICVYQGTENSGPVTRNAAEKVAQEIGAQYISWEIDSLLSGYTTLTENALGRKLDWKTDDLVLQNIQARTRAPGIWMLANTFNFLLITTSNRSEGDVGYCTMDGDTAGSLAPIAGVSKHFVRQWLVWAKEKLGYSSLQFIIEQSPTAELRPQSSKQTDEGDLMPYDLLEAIEIQLIGQRKSPEETLLFLLVTRKEKAEYLQAQIQKFVSMWKRSQWKRERMAPSFHLDRFNIDPKSGGRYPILSI
jgi:NAD+ synthase (glutamine-hydrolysing)